MMNENSRLKGIIQQEEQILKISVSDFIVKRQKSVLYYESLSTRL